MKVGSFSKHRNKLSDTNRYNGYFFTARVFQFFENYERKSWAAVWVRWYWRSDNSCTVQYLFCPKISNLEKEGNRAAIKFLGHQENFPIRSVYIMSDSMRKLSWKTAKLKGSFAFSIASNSLIKSVLKTCFEYVLKKIETRSLNCKINLKFLSHSRHCDCDATFVVIVSLLNEHDVHQLSDGKAGPGFQ